ncbi:hypothetical protein GGR57DRAFT_313459 [Xylariaceae sp. FL1272]|nr:hypothetical protein GGR57DRAFT_313459 [Xylariaceae sp. FL1272]
MMCLTASMLEIAYHISRSSALITVQVVQCPEITTPPSCRTSWSPWLVLDGRYSVPEDRARRGIDRRSSGHCVPGSLSWLPRFAELIDTGIFSVYESTSKKETCWSALSHISCNRNGRVIIDCRYSYPEGPIALPLWMYKRFRYAVIQVQIRMRRTNLKVEFKLMALSLENAKTKSQKRSHVAKCQGHFNKVDVKTTLLFQNALLTLLFACTCDVNSRNKLSGTCRRRCFEQATVPNNRQNGAPGILLATPLLATCCEVRIGHGGCGPCSKPPRWLALLGTFGV